VDAYSTNITTSAVFYSANLPKGSYQIKIGYRSSNSNDITLRNQTVAVVARKAAPPTPPPAVPVPEFSPVGLLALIAIVSAVLVIATLGKNGNDD